MGGRKAQPWVGAAELMNRVILTGQNQCGAKGVWMIWNIGPVEEDRDRERIVCG